MILMFFAMVMSSDDMYDNNIGDAIQLVRWSPESFYSNFGFKRGKHDINLNFGIGAMFIEPGCFLMKSTVIELKNRHYGQPSLLIRTLDIDPTVIHKL